MKVEFFRHNISRREIRDVNQALRGLFLTTGRLVEDFETRLAAYLGLPHVVGLTSCTGALHLSLLALGVKPGDEVITTPMTFAATALAVIQAGATPVFVDVEPETGNLDARLVEAAITPRTRAILPVHLYGQMCDMRALREIADRHGLALVEDAAHALEASARRGPGGRAGRCRLLLVLSHQEYHLRRGRGGVGAHPRDGGPAQVPAPSRDEPLGQRALRQG